MPTPPDQPETLIPQDIAVKLLHELDTLFANTAQTICRNDLDNGTLTECGRRETLMRRLAVVVKAGKIVQLMENSLLAAATADPTTSQTDIAAAMGISQQGVSYRKARLQKGNT